MKYQLQAVAGLRKTLRFDHFSGEEPEVAHVTDCRFPAGWYMIEATPDSMSMGSTLTLNCYTDADATVSTGKQCVPLGNARVAKRVIWIQSCSRYLHLSLNTEISIHAHLGVTLIRLSAQFAQKRMQNALSDHQLETQTENLTRPLANTASTTLERLYSLYCRHNAVNDIDSAYRHYPQGSSATVDWPLERLSNHPELSKHLEIILAEHHNSPASSQSPGSSQTPLVLLTTSDVRLRPSFIQVLNALVTATRNGDDETCLWYTDHDHTDNHGERVHPCFKPGWNKGLLGHGNYIGAMIIISRQLYRKLGGMDRSLGDSALFDVLLRATALIDENAVRRIPQICYTLPLSRYHSPHGFFIGEHDTSVMQAYVHRHPATGLTLSPGRFAGLWQTSCTLDSPAPSVDILIPTRDRADLLQQCIGSILSLTEYTNYSITVMDNGSVEPATHAFHEKMSTHDNYRKIDVPGDFNYSAINNLAANVSNAKHLILLNNDTEVLQGDWLQRMVAELDQDDIACVGTRLVYPNGLLQHAGVTLGLHGVAGHRNQFAHADDHGYAASISLSADVSAVTGACLGIRRLLYQALEGLNAQDLKVAFNDVDLCLRARELGYRNRYLADVTLIHHESVSRGMDDDPQKKARFQSEVDYMKRRHARWIADDPAWNPHFCRRSTTPRISPTHFAG